MYAEKENWDEFETLHPIWNSQIDNCLAENSKKSFSKNMQISIQSLIDDVDKIQQLIKNKMTKIEADFSASLKSNKAVKNYLK